MKTNIALTGIKTQELIAKTLDLYWLEAVELLKVVDGKEGVYRAVNNQIIAKALEKGEGTFIYDFNNTYDFQEDVLFTLGRSTISGVFVGDSIKKGEHSLVISGFISYSHSN